MEDKTKAEYIRIAEHFLLNRVEQPPTPKRITDALKQAASDYRPDYWRRLRIGLALQQEEAGYPKAAERIRATQNPVTTGAKADFSQIKRRQYRVKRMDDRDERALLAKLDPDARAAVTLAKHLGVRPAEMPTLIMVGDTVAVTGVKKRGTDRGLDRNIKVDDPAIAEEVRAAIQQLHGKNMKHSQDEIRRRGKEIWPKRKAVPTLYSWRHQFASNLKAAGVGRVDQAYLMGHQSTASIDSYGRRDWGNSSAVKVSPGQEIDPGLIRENHTEMPDFSQVEVAHTYEREHADPIIELR